MADVRGLRADVRWLMSMERSFMNIFCNNERTQFTLVCFKKTPVIMK